MLKIQFKDQRQAALWIVEKRYTIGSAASNHLILDDDSVDALHARLLTLDDGLFLQDNNSQRGCYVNGQRVTKKELLPGDTLRLGDVEFDVLDPYDSDPAAASAHTIPWLLLADSGTLTGREFPLPAATNIIGRGSQCEISILPSQLARQHAELTVQGNHLHVRDLGSASGVYLNDERVTEGIAKAGDRLRLDIYSFKIIGPCNGEKKRARRSHLPTSQALEKKTVSSEPKQWKTKPTSPGNRIEPSTITHSRGLMLFGTVLCCVLAALLIYLLWAN